MYYADSSFLVTSFLADANSLNAKAWLAKLGVPLPFTALHELEVPNAMRLAVFRRVIEQSEADTAMESLGRDLAAHRLVKTPLDWVATFRTAARFSEKHTVTNGSRSLDILHLAAAKAIGATEFLSFDLRQRALASMDGLHALP
jgi:predicted nucleic acid-binding protein